jgi:hypothetical protein
VHKAASLAQQLIMLVVEAAEPQLTEQVVWEVEETLDPLAHLEQSILVAVQVGAVAQGAVVAVV